MCFSMHGLNKTIQESEHVESLPEEDECEAVSRSKQCQTKTIPDTRNIGSLHEYDNARNEHVECIA
jgi:hypothetical protein